MKKSKVIITMTDSGNGKVEFKCQCQNGKSQMLNDLALHVSDKLPQAVYSAAMSFLQNKESNNAVH